MFMFMLSLIVFCLKRKHLLLMLLSLEMVVLSLYFNLCLMMLYFFMDYYFLMIFLTMSVCEGVLGLSILVSLIRTHGSDYMKSFNLLW
uniref:NADH-ubiquinone oxidoreductase chain 4L n=1 Tax=Rybaxis sp. 1 EF-2015 TaxID=1756864 RepID=A0A0S2M869_9COLE|nr:NADH deshydrogenase subunit 4L [Rybaxis sp. 1 EF-2015]